MEGIVREPGDVDMGLILGIGFPAFRGGILRWADALGLSKVLDKLQKYEKLGVRFQPTEQLRQLASAGKGFSASNRLMASYLGHLTFSSMLGAAAGGFAALQLHL